MKTTKKIEVKYMTRRNQQYRKRGFPLFPLKQRYGHADYLPFDLKCENGDHDWIERRAEHVFVVHCKKCGLLGYYAYPIDWQPVGNVHYPTRFVWLGFYRLDTPDEVISKMVHGAVSVYRHHTEKKDFINSFKKWEKGPK